MQLVPNIRSGGGSSLAGAERRNELEDCTFLQIQDGAEILQVQFSQTSQNYLYVLA